MTNSKPFKDFMLNGKREQVERRMIMLCSIYRYSQLASYISKDGLMHLDTDDDYFSEECSGRMPAFLTRLADYKGTAKQMGKHSITIGWHLNRLQLEAMVAALADHYSFLDKVLKDATKS